VAVLLSLIISGLHRGRGNNAKHRRIRHDGLKHEIAILRNTPPPSPA